MGKEVTFNFKWGGQDGVIEKMVCKDISEGGKIRVSQTEIWGKAFQIEGASPLKSRKGPKTEEFLVHPLDTSKQRCQAGSQTESWERSLS